MRLATSFVRTHEAGLFPFFFFPWKLEKRTIIWFPMGSFVFGGRS